MALWGGAAEWESAASAGDMHEAEMLLLDCTKAERRLGWRARIGLPEALAMTTEWYRAWDTGENMREFTNARIAGYMREVRR